MGASKSALANRIWEPFVIENCSFRNPRGL